MTKEDKELLLKDLCGRLQYGVILHFDEKLEEDDQIFYGIRRNGGKHLINDAYYIEEVKPYLRPMSSMAEEEKKSFRRWQLNPKNNTYDWLNANHFDYRGLIPMGLALEAKEGMYRKEAEK